LFQIDGQAALVAVQRQEDRILPFARQHLLARQVAGALALHLDNVGAEISQHLGAHRTHLDLSKVENSNAFERLDHSCLLLLRPFSARSTRAVASRRMLAALRACLRMLPSAKRLRTAG